MIGIDTNVLVRYLVRDDPEQARRARAVIEALSSEEQGFLSVIVLVETYWVLTRSYGFAPDQAVEVLVRVADVAEVVVQDAPLVRRALQQAGAGADFADSLIHQAGLGAGCSSTVTFDRRAAKTAGMDLL